MNDDAPRSDDKLALGLLIGGALIAWRLATSKRNYVRETIDGLADAARQSVESAKQVARDEADRLAQAARAHAAETDHWKVHVAPGAGDPGAILFAPGPMEGIAPDDRRWRSTTIVDQVERRHLAADHDKGGRWHWMVHEDVGNYAMLFELHGTIAKGYRPGVGLTTAFTIEHAHRHSFFPFRDSLYRDALPLDRIAAMINLHGRADHVGKRIIVDNREAWRAANDAAERSEREPRLRFYPRFEPARDPPPPVDFWAGSPDPVIAYDPERKTTFDPRTGLSLKIVQNGGPEPYLGATVMDDVGRIEHFPLLVEPCDRPGHGETRCITMQEPWAQMWGYGKEKPTPPPRRVLTREDIAPLLNAHPALFWRDEHRGFAAIIDRRIPWRPEGRF